jgi:hypothetical protein
MLLMASAIKSDLMVLNVLLLSSEYVYEPHLLTAPFGGVQVWPRRVGQQITPLHDGHLLTESDCDYVSDGGLWMSSAAFQALRPSTSASGRRYDRVRTM